MSNKITRPLLPAGVGKTYVEIAGIKWATMNIGANSETDYGLYFQWGDTAGYTSSQVGSSSTANKKRFVFATCVLHDGTSNSAETDFTAYNGSSGDGKTVLDPWDDAAVANWGGNWRMPTTEEFVALGNAVNTEWVTGYNGSGINGRLMTDKSDNSKKLFFPAAGYCYNSSVPYVGSRGTYLSSSLYSSNGGNAYTLYFNNSDINWQNIQFYRYMGCPVRPILDE